jgi:hypothetical protein
MDVTSELRGVSNDLLQALQELHDLEIEKRNVGLGTERFNELAERVEQLAAEVLRSSRAQEDLGDRAAEELADGNLALAGTTVDDQPPREVHVILAEWRDAERRRSLANAGSPEEADLAGAVEQLRLEYQRATRGT